MDYMAFQRAIETERAYSLQWIKETRPDTTQAELDAYKAGHMQGVRHAFAILKANKFKVPNF